MKRFFKGIISTVLVATFAVSAVSGVSAEKENVALNKDVTATTNYNPGEGWYSETFLTDGLVEDVGEGSAHLGWCSDPTDTSLADDTEIIIEINLQEKYTVDEVRVKKCIDTKFFPKAYDIFVSADRQNWNKVADNSSAEAADDGNTEVIKFKSVEISYLRCVITRSCGRNDWGGYLSQIGEIEVYGVFSGETLNAINKTALRMNPGETDRLRVTNQVGTVAAVWTSDNDKVATIDNTGKVTAIAIGTTKLHGKLDDKTEFVCDILVDNYKIQEKFMITTFRSPSKEHLNEYSYDLLKQAGITNVQNEWNTGTNSTEDNLLMAKLAYERGMDVTVAEKHWRDGFLNLSEEEIAERIDKYTHVPGVGGFYIIDEPYNPNPFSHAFETIHKLMPTADIHLNLLPLYSYPSYEVYQAQANDWVQSCKPENLGYLMYDLYPFTTNDTNFAEEQLLTNLNAIREVGLKTGVKTGCFVQSIGRYKSAGSTEFAGLRIPSGGDVRLQVNYSIAFGMKQLGYFCWETPVYDAGTEAFSPAIVDRYGKPTPLFDDVCTINAAVNKLGPTLMKLDAVEVYTAGNRYGAIPKVPNDFFIKLADRSQAIVSYMRDKTTGCNYCMLVNRDNVNNYTLNFTADSAITEILEVSQKTGNLETLAKNDDGSYSVTLIPGEGRLFKMPDSYDYTPNYGKRVTKEGENLALDCEVGGSSSLGSDEKYFSYAADGKANVSSGWQPNSNANEYLTIDLGNILSVNTVNVLPMKSKTFFPRTFEVLVSADGENWKSAAKADFTDAIPETPSVKFDDTNARYVKILVEKSDKKYIQISEVEVYGIGEVEIPETEPVTTAAPVEDTTSDNTQTAPVSTEPTSTKPTDEKPGANTTLITVVAIVAALAIAGVIAFVVIKKKKQ